MASAPGSAHTVGGQPSILLVLSYLEGERGLLFQLESAVNHRTSLLAQIPSELSAEHKSELVATVGHGDGTGNQLARLALDELLHSTTRECVVLMYNLEHILMILWLYSKRVPLQHLLRYAKLNSLLDHVRDNKGVQELGKDD